MNSVELLLCLVTSLLVHGASGLPQSLKEVADAIKQTDLHYYNNDVS
jgi:Sec-independent protein translocase protein TatA